MRHSLLAGQQLDPPIARVLALKGASVVFTSEQAWLLASARLGQFLRMRPSPSAIASARNLTDTALEFVGVAGAARSAHGDDGCTSRARAGAATGRGDFGPHAGRGGRLGTATRPSRAAATATRGRTVDRVAIAGIAEAVEQDKRKNVQKNIPRRFTSNSTGSPLGLLALLRVAADGEIVLDGRNDGRHELEEHNHVPATRLRCASEQAAVLALHDRTPYKRRARVVLVNAEFPAALVQLVEDALHHVCVLRRAILATARYPVSIPRH